MRLLSRGRRSSRDHLFMELFPICEIARSRSIDDIIYNRGISGLNTDEFLQHIHPLLLDLQPSKVFINIGTNDMTEEPYGDQWFQHLTANIRRILEQTQAILPNTKIYLMAFYPANLHLLGRPRLQFSGWNCGHLKILTVATSSWGNRQNLWLPLH